MYGWGSDNFTRPEALHSYEVSFAYFKGPSDALLTIAINYNGEGTGILVIEIDGNVVYLALLSH